MVQIHLSYGESTSLDMVMGFELASAWWSEVLTDEVDVYAHVDGVSEFPKHIVGGALPAIETDEKYEKIREGLLNDVTSTADQQATVHLHSDKRFSITANGDADLNKTEKMQLTRANAKALGLEKSNNTQLDGYILVSDLSQQEDYAWDFNWDRQSAFSEGNLDFFAVALHEIGHLLGFVSGVDASKWQETVIKRQDKLEESLTKMEDKPTYFKEDAMKYANPLDLFRFSADGYAAGKQDLSIGHEAYFSIDGGATALAAFSTGKSEELGGDGYQASHWKQSDQPLGIMDPVLITEQRRMVSEVDLTALDVIGWNLHPEGLVFDLQDHVAKIEASLAQRLGVTVDSLYDDPEQRLESLTRDRTKDVHKMLKDSKVYEWGSRRWSRRSSRWQEVMIELLEEEGALQTINRVPKSVETAAAIHDSAEAQEVGIANDHSTASQLPAHADGKIATNPEIEPSGLLTYPVNRGSIGMNIPRNPQSSLASSEPPQSSIYPSPNAGISDSPRDMTIRSLGIDRESPTDVLSDFLEPVLPNHLEIHPLMMQGTGMLHG